MGNKGKLFLRVKCNKCRRNDGNKKSPFGNHSVTTVLDKNLEWKKVKTNERKLIRSRYLSISRNSTMNNTGDYTSKVSKVSIPSNGTEKAGLLIHCPETMYLHGFSAELRNLNLIRRE